MYCARMFVVAPVIMALVSCAHNPDSDEEPPLLLEEPGEGREASAGPVADNSRCYVCHMNYEEEELVVSHARANVGCERCHGESDAHCGDEGNVTPPDIIYPKEKINPSCLMCHPKNKLSGVHRGVLADIAADRTYCTDCHGEHRLVFRTVRWNKATGKVLEQK